MHIITIIISLLLVIGRVGRPLLVFCQPAVLSTSRSLDGLKRQLVLGQLGCVAAYTEGGGGVEKKKKRG